MTPEEALGFLKKPVTLGHGNNSALPLSLTKFSALLQMLKNGEVPWGNSLDLSGVNSTISRRKNWVPVSYSVCGPALDYTNELPEPAPIDLLGPPAHWKGFE